MASRNRFVPVVWLAPVFAAAFLFIGGSAAHERWKALEDTVGADAAVVSTGTIQSGRSSVDWVQVRFSAPDGRAVTTTIRRASVAGGVATVRIRYKRADPQAAVLESDAGPYLTASVFFLAAAACLAVAALAARGKPSGNR